MRRDKMTKEQKKALEEMMKKAMEHKRRIQNAIQKVAEPYLKEQTKIMQQIDRCKNCVKEPFRIIICSKHKIALKNVSDTLGEIEMSFRLKGAIDQMKDQKAQKLKKLVCPSGCQQSCCN